MVCARTYPNWNCFSPNLIGALPFSIGNDQRLAPGDKARLQLDQSRGRLGAKKVIL